MSDHCITNIEGADGICRSFEDVTFMGLPLVYLLDIKIVLSYDPAIPQSFLVSKN